LDVLVEKSKNHNLGLCLRKSNIIVIDLDGPNAKKHLERIITVPATIVTKTVRGWHLFYKAPDGAAKFKIEVTDDGKVTASSDGYVLLPPSKRTDLEGQPPYFFVESTVRGPGSLVGLPKAVLGALLSSAAKTTEIAAEAIRDGGGIPRGARDTTLARMAGGMRRQGMEPNEIRAGLQAVNDDRCTPPLPDADVVRIATSIGRYPVQPFGIAPQFRTNDLVALCDITEQHMDWLVEGFIPYSAFTLLVGAGGLGKSVFALYVSARLTRGQPVFPGMASREPIDVLFLTAEDSLAHVVAPRFRLAGGDASRVHTIDMFDIEFVLPDSIPMLEAWINRHNARLVIFDPVSAYVEGGKATNTNVDSQLRREILRPLHALAETTACAILGIAHVNKSQGGDVATRTYGPRTWTNAARSSLMFGRPPYASDSDPTRTIVVAKSNYGRTGVGFDLELHVPDDEEHPVIVVTGASAIDHRDLLSDPVDPEDRSLVADCAVAIRDALANGPRAAKDVEAELKADGYSAITIRRARAAVGVSREAGTIYKEGLGGWFWKPPKADGRRPDERLPSPCEQDASGPKASKMLITGSGRDDDQLPPSTHASSRYGNPFLLPPAAGEVVGRDGRRAS
jgi:hypothetical protein